ncbi:MAG: hypothetical protein WC975_15090 [Phycisphaerae bacterium]
MMKSVATVIFGVMLATPVTWFVTPQGAKDSLSWAMTKMENVMASRQAEQAKAVDAVMAPHLQKLQQDLCQLNEKVEAVKDATAKPHPEDDFVVRIERKK